MRASAARVVQRGSGASAARVRVLVRVWAWERLRDLRVSRHENRFPAASSFSGGHMDPVGASAPSLKRPNTPMSDNLLKMRIHFV